MAKQVKLTAERRTATGRSAGRKLKAMGVGPAIIYGAKDKAEPLQVSARDINAMLSHAAGENILVELEIAGEKSKRMGLLQDVKPSPVGGRILPYVFHADGMQEKIEGEVHQEPIGIPNGVKNFGGLLEQSLRALPVECLPRDLPDRITVDVSALNIGDSIHVRDLQLPAGVTAKAQQELTVFSVLAPVVEEEPVAAIPLEGAPEGPEVITEKKAEGEGTPAAPGAKGAAGAKEPAAKEKEQKK